MTEMLNFCVGLLESIASWLGTEPIIYIVGFILATCAVKIIKTLIS